MPNTISDKEHNRGPYTVEELDALGISHDDPPKKLCEFCGKPLQAKCFNVFGKITWFAGGPCGCEESKRAFAAEKNRKAKEEKKKRQTALAKAGIAPRYQNAVLKYEECLLFLANYEENAGAGLYINGICGSGKTSLSCAIARELFDTNHSVLVTTAIDMLETIQETFNSNSSTKEAIRRYTQVDLLVIDDLGKESASDWSIQTIFQVINKRYGDMTSTIVTSEYRLSELGDRMGRRGYGDSVQAILSRLSEASTFVKLPDIDYRISKNGFPIEE